VGNSPGRAAGGDERVRDVVIIGGGAAGLAAASVLADRDLLVLDEAERLGGRLLSIARPDGGWINLGAHVLTGGSSRIAALVAEAGLGTLPVSGVGSAIWFGDRLYTRRRAEAYPVVLPLSARERIALARAGLRIRLLAGRWRRSSRRRPGESWPDYRRRMGGFESRRTFAELLGDPPARVAAIFRAAARRSAGEADEVTAGAALAIFGALWGRGASGAVTNVAGGPGRVGERWQARLGNRAVLGARVTEVREHPAHTEVRYVRGGHARRLVARHVILAVPAPAASALMPGAPAAIGAELRGIAYGPFVCVGLVTADIGAVPWDDVYAIVTPGLAFDMVFHHSSSVSPGQPVPGCKSLMAYAGGARARDLLGAPDEKIREAFTADLERVLPHLRGHVAAAVVKKWRHGNCYATPSSGLDQVLEWNRRPGARVWLAGDYFGALGGTAEAAAASGFAAADGVAQALTGEAAAGQAGPERAVAAYRETGEGNG
jgi:protoporphyrinogen/coproporphyrinogen III oxidase